MERREQSNFWYLILLLFLMIAPTGVGKNLKLKFILLKMWGDFFCWKKASPRTEEVTDSSVRMCVGNCGNYGLMCNNSEENFTNYLFLQLAIFRVVVWQAEDYSGVKRWTKNEMYQH